MQTSRILQAYAEKTPASARLFERAAGLFPGGVTHVGRYLRPHPLFTARASGSRKWDVDGNEYVDYFGGHGALILGHSHPAVVAAVTEQVAKGMHYGSSHELEVEWAELIRQMIPSAERVRFTLSGTEATMLALRVARAYKGKPMVVRFLSHFHGWQDHVAFGAEVPPGILPEVAGRVLLCPPGDIAAFRRLCESRHDIAAVILEPTGATFGQVPLNGQFLRDLREATKEHGVLLIFDEVISGFRCSPGGAQQFYQVTPDLTTLGKIIAGGMPGAALAGRADVLGVMEHRVTGQGLRLPDVAHQGTHNAAPPSAAAGIATLRLVRDTDVIEAANRTAAEIRREMNGVLRRKGMAWCVYGEFSAFHIYPNLERVPVTPEDIHQGRLPWSKLKGATPMELLQKIRAGFLLNGVDLMGWPGGLVSGVHNRRDVDHTVAAFEKLLDLLAAENAV
ncbi:MAG TPA: aminotransferase class III-fold pyridoxal phosphate-dependent enzyme [Bryobacteraceae bacterium]|nr:aminotransferase class III-fold pyridoxal phosphate-dependent enzyme [Bryobacteraceae bacterium]